MTVDEQGRTEPPTGADEVDTVLGFLDYQRATLRWKTAGVGADGLATTVGASTMTLGGLLGHMAWVEDHWLSRWLHGNEPAPAWQALDFVADPDAEWHLLGPSTPDELRAAWEAAVRRSGGLVADALADGGLDRRTVRTWPDGKAPSLRWVLLHLVEEYARHNGHADLLREVVDGQTGE